jgi:hypothetical protein
MGIICEGKPLRKKLDSRSKRPVDDERWQYEEDLRRFA